MITLLLIYLSFFGGVYGWYIPLTRLLGLGALGLGAWRAASMRRPRWVNAALLGWLAFQMVEDSFWFLSVGLVVMLLLAAKE